MTNMENEEKCAQESLVSTVNLEDKRKIAEER